MANIFYSIVKTDCQEIKSSLNENGLLEFTVPKNYTDGGASKYFDSLSKEERSEIVNKQKKTLKVFREKVEKMIDKYAKEFDLPIRINLKLLTKTKKLNDCNIQGPPIDLHGNLSIVAILQYFPDGLVEKIMRCTVLTLACEYEKCCSQIRNMPDGEIKYPDGEVIIVPQKIPEWAEYRISIPDSEVEHINADCRAACAQFEADYHKRPIGYMKIL